MPDPALQGSLEFPYPEFTSLPDLSLAISPEFIPLPCLSLLLPANLCPPLAQATVTVVWIYGSIALEIITLVIICPPL